MTEQQKQALRQQLEWIAKDVEAGDELAAYSQACNMVRNFHHLRCEALQLLVEADKRNASHWVDHGEALLDDDIPSVISHVREIRAEMDRLQKRKQDEEQ